MANNKVTYVGELDASKDFVNMKVRIIRRWKLPWGGINMILIDEKGEKIQATIKKELIHRFDEQIKEDSVVLIKKFGVGVFDDPYPVVKNHLKMNFYRCTDVCPEVSFNGHPYGFTFVPFQEITVQKSTEVLNVDVIGSVTWCGNLDIFMSSKGKEVKRFNIEIKDLEGTLLRCTLWGDYAIQFNNFVVNTVSNEHVITIIQHGVIKEWMNSVTVQTDLFGTRLFINEDIQEANDFRRRLILKEGKGTTSQSQLSSQTVYPERLEFLNDTERKHVDEIRETDKEMDCVVVGTIKMVEQQAGWFYVACRKCNKKVLTKSEYLSTALEEDVTEELINAPPESFWCPKEKCLATQLTPKFRVTLRVQDSTGSVSFLMFDRDIGRLLGVSAANIRERQLKSNDTESFPHELDALLNKVFAFKIAISRFNLERKYTVYTVLKLCSDPDVIAQLLKQSTFAEVTQEAHIPEVSTVKLSESSQGVLDSKDAFSVTADSGAVDLEKDTDTSPLQKRGTQTPGSESTTRVSKRLRKIALPVDV